MALKVLGVLDVVGLVGGLDDDGEAGHEVVKRPITTCGLDRVMLSLVERGALLDDPLRLARHHRLAEGIRRGVAAWGLSLVAEHHTLYSDTVSAIRVPQGIDARDVLRIAYEDFNTSFGSGLGPLAGKVFRIGHLGDLNEAMCLTALSVAEMALFRAGVSLQLGSGVGAAQAWYAQQDQMRPMLRVAAE